MSNEDKDALVMLFHNYELKDLINNLVNHLQCDADNFSDMGLKEAAKKCSQNADVLSKISPYLK